VPIKNSAIVFIPLLPVTALMLRGVDRISKIIGLWTIGMKKCVPSPISSGITPRKRSNIIAFCPPSTKEFIDI
jgi:hypothetical protein